MVHIKITTYIHKGAKVILELLAAAESKYFDSKFC